jgi:hypothetical protein
MELEGMYIELHYAATCWFYKSVEAREIAVYS